MLALTKELPFSEHSGAWDSWFSPSGGSREVPVHSSPEKALGGHSIFNRGEGRLREGCLGLLRIMAKVAGWAKAEFGIRWAGC